MRISIYSAAVFIMIIMTISLWRLDDEVEKLQDELTEKNELIAEQSRTINFLMNPNGH